MKWILCLSLLLIDVQHLGRYLLAYPIIIVFLSSPGRIIMPILFLSFSLQIDKVKPIIRGYFV